MKEYKVLYSDYANGKVGDFKFFWEFDKNKSCFCAPIKAQEAALNYYAKEGWQLVQAVAISDVQAYLYLERAINE